MNIKVRFAPSPTGYLHVGGLRTALYNYLYAKNQGGKIVLRIEDTDQSRKVDYAVENLIAIFNSIGINFDEGPENGGEFGPYYQSQRLGIYQEYIQKLIINKSAYPCFCSSARLEKMRELQIKNKQIIKYDRHCLSLSDSEIESNIRVKKYVIRLKIPDKGEVLFFDQVRDRVIIKCSEIDDQILIKADGFPTYHFANVVDDYLMGITHVMRGEEWLSSTPKHILLYRAFGWELPKFIHLPLLLNSDRSKLSKRQGDVAVEDYLSKGFLKETLINFVGLLGWHPKDNREFFSIEELIKEFSIKRIQKSGAVFDQEKLLWMNKHYLKNLSCEEIISIISNFSNVDKINDEKFKKLIEYAKTRISILKEFDKVVFPFVSDLEFDDEKLVILKSDSAQKLFKELLIQFKKLNNWRGESEKSTIIEYGKKLSLKGKDLFFPIRTALYGEPKGPDLPVILDILGQKETIKRIEKVLK